MDGVLLSRSVRVWLGHRRRQSQTTARELLLLSGSRCIDPSTDANESFEFACMYGHVDMARGMLALSGDWRICVFTDVEGTAVLAPRPTHLVELVAASLNRLRKIRIGSMKCAVVRGR